PPLLSSRRPAPTPVPYTTLFRSNARTSHVPAIFLLAEKDEVIAPRFQRLIVDVYAGEKRIIPLAGAGHNSPIEGVGLADFHHALDRKSTRLNSSHLGISYAVFCL